LILTRPRGSEGGVVRVHAWARVTGTGGAEIGEADVPFGVLTKTERIVQKGPVGAISSCARECSPELFKNRFALMNRGTLARRR
jgi:hypothetical protein